MNRQVAIRAKVANTLLSIWLPIGTSLGAQTLGTAFTYQGQLKGVGSAGKRAR